MLTPTAIAEFDGGEPEQTDTATFGLGCFWGPDATFGALDGVVRTRVGYAGGTEPDPPYDALGDHTEVVRLEYDPERLSFRGLLERAFAEHRLYRQAAKRQYHRIIFTETDEQRDHLGSSLDDCQYGTERLEARLERLERFSVAEHSDQKFTLRGKRWITDAFAAAGYDAAEIRDSPAAKLNAHVAGRDVSVPFVEDSYDPQSA